MNNRSHELVKELKVMKIGEVREEDSYRSIRRVPGGHIYEYFDPKGRVSAAVFVSTDELRNA